MRRVVGVAALLLLALGGLVPAAMALADQGKPGDVVVVSEAAGGAEFTADHDLAVASFGKLFTGTIISGDAASFAFQIVNQGLQPDTATWSIVSNNTTPDTADDILIALGSSPLPSGFSIKSGPGGLPWDTTGARTGDHVLTLSVEPVPQEVTTANNSEAVGVSLVEQPIHDVAVGNLAPTTADGVSPIGTSDVPSGTVLNVNVSVLNRGSVTDTILLSLFDDTDDRTITELDVTLDPGQDLLLGLSWDTSGASSGDHTLTATATLSGDADTSDNTRSTAVPVRVVLGGLTFDGVDRTLSLGFDPIAIPTEATPVTRLFSSSVDQTLTQALESTQIPTEGVALSTQFASGVDQTLTQIYVPTEIPTERVALSAQFTSGVEQTFALTHVPAEIPTEGVALSTSFTSGVDRFLSLGLDPTDVPTQPTALASPFQSGVDQTLGLELGPSPLAALARIHSESVHLQGGPDSTGAFLRVGDEVHFVAEDGSFDFPVPPGTYPMEIRAPGYLPVNIVSPSGSDISLNAGDVLTIPGLTLVYGDANGDGVIDVRDLAIGASNMSQVSEDVQVTPE